MICILLLFAFAATAAGQGVVAVACNNSYALCAYANCTVNDDNLTASCGCYSFSEPGINMAVINLIPDNDLRNATNTTCGDGSCGISNVDKAPLCEALVVGEDGTSLWPFPYVVSTFSQQLAQENGVIPDESSWSCPEAPGRFIPVCMLAPCKASEEASNPYNFGTHNMTCTCPLVEADIPYEVNGGLQDPCSLEPTNPGDYVQAAGGALLAKYQSDESLVQAAWDAVRRTFGDSEMEPDQPADTEEPETEATQPVDTNEAENDMDPTTGENEANQTLNGGEGTTEQEPSSDVGEAAETEANPSAAATKSRGARVLCNTIWKVFALSSSFFILILW